jgi:RHH-type transcriptional regulator, rel operon repressor / antitoxin RelB
MFMLGVRLPEKLEQRLNKLADETHRTRSYYVKRALEEFLQDQEDYLIALSRSEKVKRGERTYTLEEAKKKLGLLDEENKLARSNPKRRPKRTV